MVHAVARIADGVASAVFAAIFDVVDPDPFRRVGSKEDAPESGARARHGTVDGHARERVLGPLGHADAPLRRLRVDEAGATARDQAEQRA